VLPPATSQTSPTSPARSARDGVSFHASPLLVGSGIAALASTILLAVMSYLDINAARPLPRGPGQLPGPPPPSHAGLLIAIGLFTIAWVAVVAAICRDQIVRRINAAAEQITTAALDYGEHRYNEGYFRALTINQSEQPPPIDDPPSGEVLHFPRQPGSPDSEQS
jgi:hypothetical protein